MTHKGDSTGERSITLLSEVLKISPEAPDLAVIRYAANLIRRGELVAIPTDTFYGIAADPGIPNSHFGTDRIRGQGHAFQRH